MVLISHQQPGLNAKLNTVILPAGKQFLSPRLQVNVFNMSRILQVNVFGVFLKNSNTEGGNHSEENEPAQIQDVSDW